MSLHCTGWWPRNPQSGWGRRYSSFWWTLGRLRCTSFYLDPHWRSSCAFQIWSRSLPAHTFGWCSVQGCQVGSACCCIAHRSTLQRISSWTGPCLDPEWQELENIQFSRSKLYFIDDLTCKTSSVHSPYLTMLFIFFHIPNLSNPRCFAEFIKISLIHSGSWMLHLTLKHVEMIKVL